MNLESQTVRGIGLGGESRVAYFSMEIALQPEIPTYSGGLGILAGDTMRSSADLELRMVAVSLVSRLGYFRQTLDEAGNQQEQPEAWQPESWTTPLDAIVTVPIEGRRVWVGGWLYLLEGESRGQQPVILLDTNLYENTPEDRTLTDRLYGGDEEYRLKQEIVLGVGGVRMLAALGFDVSHYHMNEGHSSLLALELLRRHALPASELRPGESPYVLGPVRELCSFTTHTPVESGHDKFSYDLVSRLMPDFIDLKLLRTLAGWDRMNMTRLALSLSEIVNGVTKRHARTAQELYPGITIRAITNGVHPLTWTCSHLSEVYDNYLPGWNHEPEMLVRLDCCVPDMDVRLAHAAAKQDLIDLVEELTTKRLDADVIIIGFARRMTAYKRPDLLFSDLDRLRQVASETPIQVVMAGKAHPADSRGKQLIRDIYTHIKTLGSDVSVVYLPNYEMAMAKCLVAGVDLWLNTPLPPMEASGTSGMKAALNGVPSLSVLDGWWIEGCIEGVTGWSIDTETDVSGRNLYDKLESTILPLYYDNKDKWLHTMKTTISKNGSLFTSHRMMRRYVCEAYIH